MGLDTGLVIIMKPEAKLGLVLLDVRETIKKLLRLEFSLNLLKCYRILCYRIICIASVYIFELNKFEKFKSRNN